MKSVRIFCNAFLPVAFMMLLLSTSLLNAQDTTAGKQIAYITMKYAKENGEGKVYFKVFTLSDKKKIPVQYTIVNLFLEEISKWGMMGNITSDENGEGVVPLGGNKFATLSDSMPVYNFIGSLKNDPHLLETKTALPIRAAALELLLYQQDSARYAKAVLKEKNELNQWVPAKGVKVDFFVKKYFTLLPSVFSDENGEAILKLPDALKGDSVGNLKIAAMIYGNDNYGTLITTNEKPWGSPEHPASYAASPFFKLIIIGFFAAILYLLIQVIQIKNLLKSKDASA